MYESRNSFNFRNSFKDIDIYYLSVYNFSISSTSFSAFSKSIIDLSILAGVILELSKVKNYLIIKNGQKEISDEEIETFFN